MTFIPSKLSFIVHYFVGLLGSKFTFQYIISFNFQLDASYVHVKDDKLYHLVDILWDTPAFVILSAV